ncbi:MAG: hypothetical protein RBR86_02200 [Pseudobdellovibrionaceae bacterium]|jgi:putative ABC transport system permease protein|nr:hypothetical protein [Pseudobdellovibrionaceae bacterium]
MTLSETFLGLRWALRDIRGAWSSFILVLICLIIGLAAITTVQIMAGSILSSIQQNGRVILGADWIARQIYSPIGEAEREWLVSKGASLSESVELRPMIINPETEASALVELKVVDQAYPLYGTFDLESGGDFEAAINRGALLDPSLRDKLSFYEDGTVQIGQVVLPVTGWIKNEPDRAGGGRFALAPRVLLSRENFSKTGLENPGSLITYQLRVKWPEGTELKEDVFKDAFPDATWRLTTHENASPSIQRFVNNILQFLTLVGLSALLIGGIGIANGLRTYFEARLTSIAIYKMVGTPQRLLRAVYFWQISIVTLIGVSIGLALGAILPWIGLNFVRDFLPFPIVLHYKFLGFAIPAVFSVLTMWLFALWPFGQAERTSPLILFRQGVAEANERPSFDLLIVMALLAIELVVFIFITATDQKIALSFIGGAFVCFMIYMTLGHMISIFSGKRAGRSALMPRLALINLGGARNATVLTLVSIGIGLTVLSGITLIDRNLRGILTENMPKDAPAFFFVDIQPEQKDAFVSGISSFSSASNLVMTPNLRGRIKAVNGIPADKALKDARERWLLQNDRGFTYLSEQPAHSEITAGEWWPTDYKGPPLVSVVDDVERGFGVKPGDTITVTILGRDITATIANVREVNWTNFTINFAITFSPGVLEAAPHNWLATVVAPPEAEADLQKKISASFPNISLVRVSDAVQSLQLLLDQMVMAVRIMAILALVTGVFVLSGALLATRMRRSYDAVILKVLGAPQSLLLKSLCLEFLMLGGVAALLAGGLGLVISWGVMVPLMDWSWNFYPMTTIVIVSSGALVIFLTGIVMLKSVLSNSVRSYLQE